ncbi:uncharacterized protein E0L32_002339 [Thyridium curvatum]|uniref:Uncharacterized protein n=1 Tax=Thyridium curvatum TaxID=1093900 RepID=A0A507AI97_9PEZI|nr:uncharacterized protein E0L32_002339 [Thyridium curvatum]TPX06843.1 hypothetical protein E0L32_002339 [Thyridium curvatum]
MDFKSFFGIRGGASVVPLSDRRGDLSPNDIHSDIGHPEASKVGSLFVVILGSSICFAAFTQRVTAINNWRKVPFITWVALILYLSAFIFFMSSALFEFPLGIDQNISACSATAALCLFNYVFSKNCYFLFLIDRVHIIRGSVCHRLKSKLYVCNIIATIGSYIGYNALYSTFKLSEGHIPFVDLYGNGQMAVISSQSTRLATLSWTNDFASSLIGPSLAPAVQLRLLSLLVEVLVVFALTRPEHGATVPSRSSTNV